MADFIDLGLDQIRQNGVGNVAVQKRLLEDLLTLANVAVRTPAKRRYCGRLMPSRQ